MDKTLKVEYPRRGVFFHEEDSIMGEQMNTHDREGMK
jgi:hypothetical protein